MRSDEEYKQVYVTITSGSPPTAEIDRVNIKSLKSGEFISDITSRKKYSLWRKKNLANLGRILLHEPAFYANINGHEDQTSITWCFRK